MDDSTLIAGVLAGDRAAARLLYDRHVGRVYRLIYRLVGREDLAREFTQDTFVRAFSRLQGFRGEAAFTTWLHTVAVSVVRSGMRRVIRLERREMELDSALELPSESNGATDPDLRDRLISALESLPEKLRTVVILHDMEGHTHQQISGLTGVPEGTSKTRLAVARAQLREALAAYAPE